ncbi:cytochrome P450 [Aeromicrobium panaciterrae]|uniref:Cytochrome P450 n=1 Tax=Aeromicrobium panaciterrae TaxID=363861 RepID=A0ABU1UMF2_9ACTN|nr:cytochrome P450 [Aeromicrobium panaciterrae]MDR7086329.1 cytochrome P450 [Aeromicrobium panaciterrae]
MTAVSSPLVFDPYDYAFHEDPYPLYARLRAESPVFHAPADDLWVVASHADVREVLRDDRSYSNQMGVSLDASAWTTEAHRVMSFLALDGDEQTRLRKLVSGAFTPRRVRDLEPQIERLTKHYLDLTFAANAEHGEVDWITEFAGRLPMDVISELLGVPEGERDEARRLADLTVHREDGVRDVPEDGMLAAFELIDYFADLVKQRRKNPLDDLTSALTMIESNGDRLTDEEINAFLFLMVVAGNETTTKLLGNALFHLSASPEQQKEVYAAPEDLVSDWIEETLRHDTSSQMLARYVLDDVEVGGQLVPAGSKLLVLLGSANRDEEVFSNPDVFDIHRAKDELGQSLSFGTGRHFCLGAHLARLEAKVVLDEMIRRTSSFQVHSDRAVRVHSTSVRGFRNLPVTFSGVSS